MSLTILITLSVRNKRINELECHLLILLVVSKWCATSGFKMNWHRSHRATEWVNVCTTRFLNTYKLSLHKSDSSQDERQISKTSRKPLAWIWSLPLFVRQASQWKVFLVGNLKWTRLYFILFILKNIALLTLILYWKDLCCDAAAAGNKEAVFLSLSLILSG